MSLIVPKDAELVPDDTLRRVEKVIGKQSAAADAIRDLEKKRGEGINAVALYSRSQGAFFIVDAGQDYL